MSTRESPHPPAVEGGSRPGSRGPGVPPLVKPDARAAAHARFARAALFLYLAAAAASVALLMASLYTDEAHDEEQAREKLLVQADARAHSLGQHLSLLVAEVRRLAERSEVDLRDEDLAPEKSLLRLAHEQSTFFNLGVAILDKKGQVVWSEPQQFLPRGQSFGHEGWFEKARESGDYQIVPVQPDRTSDSAVYVVSPLVNKGEFTGQLLGAVDLAKGEPLSRGLGPATLTVVAMRDGTVVYPAAPPAFSAEPNWRSLFARSEPRHGTQRLTLEGAPRVIASSQVFTGSGLTLLVVAREADLYAAATSRVQTRLALGLLLALSPAVLLLLMLRRSLRDFRKSEEEAVREERLRLLGEAANSIAHEVKNALNGLSMGLDLVVREGPAARKERILTELRREIQRLSDFTTELMTFSRGVEPRRTRVDLGDFLPKVTGLLRDAATELGAEIELSEPSSPVFVEADPTLLHAVISNLAGNALDAATAGGPQPRVEVRLSSRARVAEVRVSDNGAGVSASMKPRLFEPFQTEKPNGVGIGLALARKIARAHGGDLILEETRRGASPLEGASFLLTLPLLEDS